MSHLTMLKAVFEFTSGLLMFVELLTVVTFLPLICDVRPVTCAAVISRKFTPLGKHYRSYNSELRISAQDASVQRGGTVDGSSSPTTSSDDSENLFESQENHPVSEANILTASRNEKSVSAEKEPDFRETLPYFFHMISVLSHTVTHHLHQSSTSDQKSIKDDGTSTRAPSIAKGKREIVEKHPKFESGSQKVSGKAQTLPPADPETSEVNRLFQNEKWQFSYSENISFSNSSATANATEIYERWEMPALYEDSNDFPETALSSSRFISNFTSNKSAFVDYGSDHVQVKALSNATSDVERLRKVINSSDSTENGWSPQGERSSDLNVGSEMNDGVITSANANDLGINIPAVSNIQAAGMSPATAVSETDEKLDALTSPINRNGTRSGTPNSFVEMGIEMRLDNDNNGSVTKDISGVVKFTKVAEVNNSALYSEVQRSELKNGSAEYGVNDTSEVGESGSDVTVSNFEAEDAIESESAGSEVKASSGDTGGGDNGGNARMVEEARGIRFVSGIDVSSDVMPNNLHHDLGRNGSLNVTARDSLTVSSGGHGGYGAVDAFDRDHSADGTLLQKQGSVMSSRIQTENFDSLRALKTRDTEVSRLHSNNVNSFVLENDETRSGFAKSSNSNKIKYRNTEQRDSADSSSKDVVNLSLGSGFLHPKTVNDSDTLLPLGKNITVHPDSGSAGSSNGTSFTYTENTSFELPEKTFDEFSALASKLFTGRVNSVNDDETKYLHSSSENLTFIADVFSTSAENLTYTTNQDMQKNVTVSLSDKNALEVKEYYNSSEMLYEFVGVRPTSDITAEFNFDGNTSNSYNATFSAPDYYDKYEETWSSVTPVLSTPESTPGVSVNNGSGASVSGVLGRNGSVSDDEPGWPVKLSAEVSGDLILGGLMMVHERQDNTTCGPIMPQGGIQALETMLYTLDMLNRDPKMIPNVTIGAHILDDCDKDTYGLEMAVDFIKGRRRQMGDFRFNLSRTSGLRFTARY